MNKRSCSPILILLAVLAGCSSRAESQVPSEQAAAAVAAKEGPASPPVQSAKIASAEPCDKEASQRKGYQVLRTNDVKEWPCITLPLDVEIKVPEVPEKITRPSPPIKESAEQK